MQNKTIVLILGNYSAQWPRNAHGKGVRRPDGGSQARFIHEALGMDGTKPSANELNSDKKPFENLIDR